MRKLWLLFSQAVTVLLAALFVVSTLKPQWLAGVGLSTRTGSSIVSIREAVLGGPTAVATYAPAAKRAMPAVVSIATTKALPRNPHANEPWFKYFFGDQAAQPELQRGLGSGVIVSPQGYILTNNHVVEGVDEIELMLSDGRRTTAKVVGTDPDTDLAVLKIDLKDLPAITFGSLEKTQVGDVVLAIGNPFDVGQTVTMGIVSALGRNDLGINTFENFIQTDAAINPGNSGGPLLNTRGEVIGVNTMIATRSGAYEGIGFALPMNMAVKVYNSVIQHGRVTRGYIGITWNRRQKPETLKAMGLESGVFVEQVTKGGPAEKAGLKENDIIVLLNGKPVKDGNDLVNRVADLPVGSTATVTVDRDGKRIDHKLTIGDREEGMRAQNGVPESMKEESVSGEGTPAKFGISIRELSGEERDALTTPEKKGVRVAKVEEGSFAEEIGMQEGDVIIWVNRQPTGSLDDIRKVQAKLKPGDAVAFGVMRPNPASRRLQYVRITLSGTLSAQ